MVPQVLRETHSILGKWGRLEDTISFQDVDPRAGIVNGSITCPPRTSGASHGALLGTFCNS